MQFLNILYKISIGTKRINPKLQYNKFIIQNLVPYQRYSLLRFHLDNENSWFKIKLTNFLCTRIKYCRSIVTNWNYLPITNTVLVLALLGREAKLEAYQIVFIQIKYTKSSNYENCIMAHRYQYKTNLEMIYPFNFMGK